MFKHLLIATDGSEIAAKAVRGGLELAKSLGARALVVTAADPWLGLNESRHNPSLFPG
jgi:nucleotide-binding universal stress UspA family protein